MKAISHVFAIRHGHYDGCDGPLSDAGILQVRGTAKEIQKILGKEASNIYLFHSPLLRAVQTANVLSNELSGIINVAEVLDLEDDSYEDGKEVSEMILELLPESNEPMIVIAVTHFEAPSGVIDGFLFSLCNKDIYKPNAIGYAGGFYLKVETGESRRL